MKSSKDLSAHLLYLCIYLWICFSDLVSDTPVAGVGLHYYDSSSYSYSCWCY